MLEVELVCKIGHHGFHCQLCERLSEANPSSAIEWCISERMSLLSIRCQMKRVVLVKPLRKKLSVSLPMISVDVKPVEVHLQPGASLHAVIANGSVLVKNDGGVIRNWVLESKGL